MIFIVSFVSLLAILAVLVWKARADDAHKAESAENERLIRHYQLQADELAEQFRKHGAHATIWTRPKHHNKADDFYYLVKIKGENHLFTQEQMVVAEDRAIKAAERGWL